MATIGPNISFSSVGPAGSPDIAYSNMYMSFQSPWGVDGAYQVCTSFSDFQRLYGGLNKLASVASGTTADTFTTETNDAVIQAYYNALAYFTEKGNNSPGVLFACRTVASSSGPTAASKTFPDFAASDNTTIASKWKGIHGATTQVTVITPSPRKGIFAIQTGTLAVSSSSTAVTGTGTSFVTGSAWNGWGIKIGVNYYTIASVTDGTHLVLNSSAVATETAAVFSVGNNTTYSYFKFNHPQSGIVEEWDVGTAADASNVSKLSQLCTLTLPAGGQLPVSATASKLNSGSAPTADSYAATDADLVGTVSATNVKTGLQAFNDQRLGTGLVTIPGKTSATIRAGIKAHCEAFYRFGFLGPTAGLNLTTAQTEYANITSNFCGGWVPRVYVADQNSTSNGQILVDNVGHLAGLCARMDRDYGGPHKSPAGIDHSFVSALDVELQSNNAEIYDDAASNLLADVYTNTLRRKGSIVSYGLRTLATDERYRQIQAVRTICLVYLSCYQLMSKVTFEPIDPFGRLFSRMNSDLNSFFFTLRQQGSLYGTQPGKDPKSTDAWFVVCGLSNNPNVQIGKGVVRADVSFVPTLNAERIDLPIMVAAPGFGAAAAGV